MAASSIIGLMLLTLYVTDVLSDVTLRELKTVYVPYRYTPDLQPEHALFSEASEQIAVDRHNHLVYTIGGSGYLHVVDIRDPVHAQVLFNVLVPGVPNDIDVCGGYVGVTVRNESVPLSGHVALFTTYNRQLGRMDKVQDIPVGSSPASMITFTRDCHTILVANEGEAGKDENGRFLDPEGSISIINFKTDNLNITPIVRTADFRKFNARAEEYVKQGVRWVYHGQRSGRQTTFAHDMEPEYLALSPDEKMAYVVLQENNAFAMVDVENAEVLDIYPMGFKDWQSCGGLDASDLDGGINIHPWPVWGMYQPDAIKLFEHNGATYVVTANEGDAKDYNMREHGITWSERTRGQIFVKGNLLAESVSDEMEDALADENLLGRIRMSRQEGRIMEGHLKYDQFYVYGGRSFSIWNTNDMGLVYDSGSEIERYHSELMPNVFNSHVEDIEHLPEQDGDFRSDDMGPEVEVVETATIGNKTYLFVGNQRVSTIITYSVEGEGIQPKFEGLHRGGGLGKSWETLFYEENIGDSDMQDMKYIQAELSPTQRPLLLVSGSLGGTLAIYEIEIHEDV